MGREHRFTIIAALCVLCAALFGACSSETDATTGGSGGSAAAAGSGLTAGGGGAGVGGLNMGGEAQGELTIDPQNPVIQANGTPTTLLFTALLDGSPVTTNAVWWVDDAAIGAFLTDPVGTFRSGGVVAGQTPVNVRVGAQTATTTVTVEVAIVDNAAGLDAAAMDALRAGGSADATFRWLYPYDQTVFPRGLAAPSLQLAGTAADATYVRLSVPGFSYEGFFGASSPIRVELPETAWNGLTHSAGGSDDVTVEISKRSGADVTGPATETWRIAQGSLKGIIYYNTYQSPAAGYNGAVMRIRPGSNAEVVVGGCTVCHAVSAQGNVIASGVSWATDNPIDSMTGDLGTDGSLAARYTDSDGRKFSFAALTPDGSLAVSEGVRTIGPQVRGLAGDFPTKVWDTATGLEVAAPSLTGVISYAYTPVFSPDGTRLAFNWHEHDNGHSIAAMDVDLSQSPPLFSNLVAIATVTEPVAGWPSFLADSAGLLFHAGDAFDTAGYGGTPRYANLRLALTNGSGALNLDTLNGTSNSTFYLPYGAAEEANLNYEPTVLPVPVGGYYWVVFTSRRCYGNTIAPGGTVAGGDNKWGTLDGNGEHPSPRKKLWVAAIDLDYASSLDPSHPAFYLPGQELAAGNMRGFAALEPCKPNGETCESAAECCEGFCRETGEVDEQGVPITACVPPPEGCSNEDETCETAADCCDIGFMCINGRCAQPTPA